MILTIILYCSRKSVGIAIVVLLIVAGIGTGVYFIVKSNQGSDVIVRRGAVVTSIPECSEIAVEILKRGSAADAAITAALCIGLTVPQSSGLGGGLVLTIYTKETGITETLNAREVAPMTAKEDMFVDNPDASLDGGLAIAVPGELKGLFALHEKYGKLKWSELVQPVADLARNGFKVSTYLGNVIKARETKIRDNPEFAELLLKPDTGELYKEGDTMKVPKYADTLDVIAREGSDALYNGTFTKTIVQEIQNIGGIITVEDLNNYKVKWGKPVSSKLFNGDTLSTFPLPATGSVLTFILNVLKGFHFEDHSLAYHQNEKLMWHRLMESFKFAFAKRTVLGADVTPDVEDTLKELESEEYAEIIRKSIQDDLTFNDYAHYGVKSSVNEDHGTAHMSILSPNGDAVSLTSTINLIFGSWRRSPSTGIFFNDEMNDFSIPGTKSDGLLAAPANFIKPGKAPMSSMSPTIVTKPDGTVKLVLGGAGGIRIMTAIVYVIINHMFLNQTLEYSINTARIHHQLSPMQITYEDGFNLEILQFLETKGHKVVKSASILSGFSSVNGISVAVDGKLEAAIDHRRGGKAIIFEQEINNKS
ncbi:unnamed protein product [Diamesa serratosioi]